MKPRGAGGRNWHWYGVWGKYLVWSSFGFGGRRYFIHCQPKHSHGDAASIFRLCQLGDTTSGSGLNIGSLQGYQST